MNVATGLRAMDGRGAEFSDGPRANILIVDDRADKLLVFKVILEELQQNVVTMQSGEDALRWLLENDCAVLLLDVNMPGMDGFETAELVRAHPRSAHLPIIFITAYADEMHTARGYSLGAVDYIMSPVVPENLRSKVSVFVQLYILSQQAKKTADENLLLAREQAARAAAEESTRRANFLAEASKTLSSSLDISSLMAGATRLLVPMLAEFSAITVVDGPESLVKTASASDWRPGNLYNALVHAPAWLKAIDDVLATGGRKIIGKFSFDANIPSDHHGNSPPSKGDRIQCEVEQVVMLPLVARGKTRGVLSIALGTSGKHFGDAQIALAADMAARVAMALDNCLLFKEIQDADQRKNRFLATLSHELRNPLAPLRTAIHALHLSGQWPATGNALREMMERQIEHMSHLLDDLLDVARITQGKIHLRMEKVDLAAKILRVLETCRPRIDEAGHELRVFLPSESIWVEGDRVRLQQILENILINAGKYTKHGGRIDIRLNVEDGDAVIRIRDTGVGIAAEMLPKIWEMFAQADNSPDQAKSGLGIGLSLTRELVQLHAGHIEARSEGLGKGSEFIVRLPLANPAEADQRPVETAAMQKAGAPVMARRILVVDDNADAAESLGELLGILGHTVKIAYDGVSALQSACADHPELVFLDIGLPEMDGYEVARRLRKEVGLAEAKIIALSGYGSECDHLLSKQAGIDLHLVKPVDPRRLSTVVDSMLASGV